MYAAALRVELRMRGIRSLKAKRNILRSLVADLIRKFPVSIAEVDHQNLWQRTAIGFAVVAPQAGQLERLLHSIERALRNRAEVEVLRSSVGYLEDPM